MIDSPMEIIARSPYAPSSVKRYFAGLVALWDEQRTAGINSYPSPRCSSTKVIMHALDLAKNKRSKENYEDKGKSASTLCHLDQLRLTDRHTERWLSRS